MIFTRKFCIRIGTYRSFIDVIVKIYLGGHNKHSEKRRRLEFYEHFNNIVAKLEFYTLIIRSTISLNCFDYSVTFSECTVTFSECTVLRFSTYRYIKQR